MDELEEAMRSSSGMGPLRLFLSLTGYSASQATSAEADHNQSNTFWRNDQKV
jgi:hypothetical protein